MDYSTIYCSASRGEFEDLALHSMLARWLPKSNCRANWLSAASCPRLPLRAPHAVLCCTPTSRGHAVKIHTHTYIAPGHSHSFYINPCSLISIPTSYFHTNSPSQASRARRRINDVYTTSHLKTHFSRLICVEGYFLHHFTSFAKKKSEKKWGGKTKEYQLIFTILLIANY